MMVLTDDDPAWSTWLAVLRIEFEDFCVAIVVREEEREEVPRRRRQQERTPCHLLRRNDGSRQRRVFLAR